jgi:uncharacterized membrane-anchored protein
MTRFSIVPPMRAASVPAIGVRYWTAISLASIAGCNLGDFVSLYLHLGHWRGLFPVVLVLALLLFAESRSRRASEGWYWAVIIVIRTAATNLSDLATNTFNIEFPWVIAVLELLQVLVVLPVAPRQVPAGSDSAGLPVADGWYWASMLTAGTLGTAIGDCVADGFNLGTGRGTLVLSAILGVVLVIGTRARWSKASYWFAIVAVRAAGTTAGDYLAFHDGLGLGLALSTACTTAVFVAVLLFWRRPASGAADKSATQSLMQS